ncbi:MAG TPA: hypothetical protein VFA04_05760 [Bryobacteraceae bacterium]|nr:hypothetical protein [Bryobacteraceae bacterium]
MIVSRTISVTADDSLHAGHAPVGGDHILDQELLETGAGPELATKLGVNTLEFGGILEGEDHAAGGGAVFDGVLG